MLDKLARLFMHNIDRVTNRPPVIRRFKHSSPSFLEDENRKSRALLAADVGSRDKLTTGFALHNGCSGYRLAVRPFAREGT